jgi:predicted O-linked N-acetylglucosamine transferase (SPINDLY family)
MNAAAKVALAFASLREGRTSEAEALCADVIRQEPAHAVALHLLGLASLRRGNPAGGIAFLRSSLRSNPNDALVHCNLGNALREAGQSAAAAESYRQALRIAPQFAGAHYGHGNALMDLCRVAEALDSFDRAIALQPDHVDAHNNRGNALLALGEPQRAVESYRRALELRPKFGLAIGNMAKALAALEKFEDALRYYDRLLMLSPDDPEAAYGRGLARRRLRQHDLALDDFERAHRLAPQSSEYLYRKAEALRDLGRYSQAAAAFHEVLKITPDREFALGNFLHARLQVCDWDGYEKHVERALREVAEGKRAYFPGPFLSVADSAEAQWRCARAFASGATTTRTPALWTGERYRHDRIRVAYVSADFRDHPVSTLLVGVLESHDRARFEIHGVALAGAQPTPLAQRVRSAFDQFSEVSGNSDREIAVLLREREIDIVVDLMGLSGSGRPGIFAHRPAPVQLSYLGYCATTASPDIDYLIADRIVIPAEERHCYTEQVVYLPDCYQPSDDQRAIAPDTPSRGSCGLPEDAFVFCCFNTHYKIAPRFFDAWMRLLKATPGSVLWLSAAAQDVVENLRSEAAAHDVAPQRLVFAPRLARPEEHLARYRRADLFLDTLPFNAHATASDALWAALPVLTCRGGSFAGRVAASLLTALRMPELITTSLEEYESRALELASHPVQLRALRERLQVHRRNSPLFDTARYCAHLEKAYSAMFDKAQRGQPPASFAVGAAAPDGICAASCDPII